MYLFFHSSLFFTHPCFLLIPVFYSFLSPIGGCYLKRQAVASTLIQNAQIITGTPPGVPMPQNNPTCTLRDGWDLFGNDINNGCAADQRVASAELCCARCQATSGCRAFSFTKPTDARCPGSVRGGWLHLFGDCCYVMDGIWCMDVWYMAHGCMYIHAGCIPVYCDCPPSFWGSMILSHLNKHIHCLFIMNRCLLAQASSNTNNGHRKRYCHCWYCAWGDLSRIRCPYLNSTPPTTVCVFSCFVLIW